MRLSSHDLDAIRAGAAQVAGGGARVWVFGSRLDDAARGGDVDLLLEIDEPVAEPALLAAQLAARVSRALHGRKVDVVLKAPNLRHLPIHDIALQEGVRL